MLFDGQRVKRRGNGSPGRLRKMAGGGDLWFVEHDDGTLSAAYTDQLENHWEAEDELGTQRDDRDGAEDGPGGQGQQT